MGSEFERGNKNRNAKIDRICNLPNEVISCILSLLPTKDAVGTSILSRRWKYLWTFIFNLDFDSTLPCGRNEFSPYRFASFVDRVFNLSNSVQIQKFELVCYNIDTHHSVHSRVATWINEAVRRNVCELDLVGIKQLPLSFFTCKTLKVLKLGIENDYTGINCPSSFCLPCLKILDLNLNCYLVKKFTGKLIHSCPVLEELSVEGELGSGVLKNFNVSAPVLKKLTILFHDESYKAPTHKIFINAPILEILDLDDDRLATFMLESSSVLVKASVNIGDDAYTDSSSRAHALLVHQLLKKINGVRSLSLHTTTSCALYTYGYKLPTFRNLTCLEVEIPDFPDNRRNVLPRLLESSPNLQVLVLEKQWYSNGFDDVNEEFKWRDPKSVPNCLLLHLQVIKLRGIRGNRSELTLVKYLLGSAKVLKKLTINYRFTQEEKLRFCEKLLEFPRGSTTCQVQFSEVSS